MGGEEKLILSQRLVHMCTEHCLFPTHGGLIIVAHAAPSISQLHPSALSWGHSEAT